MFKFVKHLLCVLVCVFCRLNVVITTQINPLLIITIMRTTITIIITPPNSGQVDRASATEAVASGSDTRSGQTKDYKNWYSQLLCLTLSN